MCVCVFVVVYVCVCVCRCVDCGVCVMCCGVWEEVGQKDRIGGRGIKRVCMYTHNRYMYMHT